MQSPNGRFPRRRKECKSDAIQLIVEESCVLVGAPAAVKMDQSRCLGLLSTALNYSRVLALGDLRRDLAAVQHRHTAAPVRLRAARTPKALSCAFPEEVDVRAIRAGLKLTREEFAVRFGFAKSAAMDWEQGRRQPERSARILLKVIEIEPKAVEKALRAA